MNDSSTMGAGKAARQAAQRRRLAAALRENLRRRKAKVRASVVAATDSETGPEEPTAPHDSAGIAGDKQSQ